MMQSSYIAQGEFAIGDRASDVISATLGSCVSVCLWDEEMQIGGMNHILLPGVEDNASKYGSADMERLINALLQHGARRNHMTAKVFGGASMLVDRTGIGRRNAEFALEYLRREGIPCLAKSTGGAQARQVKFFPYTGAVKHRFVASDVKIETVTVKAGNDVEMF